MNFEESCSFPFLSKSLHTEHQMFGLREKLFLYLLVQYTSLVVLVQ